MNIVTGDIEANGFLDTATRIWCAVFKDHSTGKITRFVTDDNGEFDAAALCNFLDSVQYLAMHNGLGYDLPLIEKLYGYKYKGTIYDTLIVSRLLRPNRVDGHSVEAWGKKFGLYKQEHEDWTKFSEDMLRRCERDVEIQHRIYLTLQEEAKQGKWNNAIRLTHKLFQYLYRQERYGWKVDVDHMDNCISVLDRWISYIDRAIASYLPLVVEVNEVKKNGEYGYVRKPFKKDGSLAGSALDYYNHYDEYGSVLVGPFSRISFRRVDLDSNKELKEMLLRFGWEPAEWNLDKDGKRTSPKLSKDDPFNGIKGSIGRLIARRVQCKQRKAIIEGWKTVVREDGRIPSVVTGIATTGRAKHTNIVNVPRAGSFFGKWMRRIFIAKPGWVLVGTDSDGNQMRMLAARMGDEDYKNTILNGDKKKGTDQHSVNQRILGLDDRDTSKTFFYGVVFGASDTKAGKIVGDTREKGKELKERLFSGLPALRNLINKLTEEWRKNAKKVFNKKYNRMEYSDGWFTGLDGRPIYCESEHAVLVYALQSDEAIMMSAAYVMFNKKMDDKYKFGEDWGCVCWYHDEWTAECKPEIAEDVANIAKACIKWAGEFYKINCPHAGDSKIGKNWADIH